VRPGWFAWLGASLVWAGAATLSFSGLDGLAVSCYIAPGLAPLLPLVIDVGVAVAAWVWRRGANEDAARLAGRMTWSLLTLTIVGNGAHLGMEASHVLPPWWAAAIVGAIPPAVAGATAHLLVLLGRVPMPDTYGQSDSDRVTLPGPRGVAEAAAPKRPVTAPTTGPKTLPAPPDSLLAETRALLPIGRRALATRLEITEHQARALLEQAKPRNGARVLEDA
jgi:hypothetical protein